LFSADYISHQTVPANKLIFAMLTHQGRVRRANQDFCAAAPAAGAFVVCDGMGGAAGGEVASNLAAETFLAHLPPVTPGDSAAPKPQTRLNAAIQAANQAVYLQARHTPQLSGMGTTLVALLHAPVSNGTHQGSRVHANSRATDPPTLWLAHVGDSRCYRRRRGHLQQLTDDHSLVEEQLRAGQITPAQAAESPMRNLITRAIGSQATVEADIQSYHPQLNDVYLLTSDGLTREVTDQEIESILATIPCPSTTPALTEACEALISAANRNGGNDNITVLLVALTPA
jgi:protein phosphatase